MGGWAGKDRKTAQERRCKQKLKRGSTSVCKGGTQEYCTELGYAFAAVTPPASPLNPQPCPRAIGYPLDLTPPGKLKGGC